MVGRSVGWSVGRSVSRLVGQSDVGRSRERRKKFKININNFFVGRSVNPIGRSVGRSVGQSIGWLVGQSVHQSVGPEKEDIKNIKKF